MKNYLIFILFLCFTISCNQNRYFNPDIHVEKVWKVQFPDIGIYSSPRATDLTGDGVKDLIFGTGKLEMQETEIGIVAINGAIGDTIWTLPSRDQMFGSANLIDLTGDGIDDIIINGRAATLFAIEGKTGNIIWEFLSDVNFEEAREMGYYNFYNPQFIPDQTGDELPDILVANGGDFTVPPNDPNRPPGKLMVIASRTGELISEAYVPDGKETYMSAVVSKLHDDDEVYSIIYGTGGETMGGKLFRTTLNEVMNGDLSNSIELASSEDKGFIAPPVLADLNNDGYLDIAVNAVNGTVLAFSGKNNTKLWEVQIENTEAYGSIAVGNFVDKIRTDLFVTLTIGVWPDLIDNIQLLINGETGDVLQRDTLGVMQTATPVAADFNNDGFDDALVSINFGYEQFDGSFHYQHIIGIIDFHNNHQYALDSLQPGANLASTPWVGDLDGNGKLDIIYSVLGDEKDIFAMNGFKMVRLKSHFNLDREVKWGNYMGSEYTGVFKK